MKAIDLCNILKRNYRKGEFQCNMDSCGDKPCDLCTVEKFEKEVRADQTTKILNLIDTMDFDFGYYYDFTDDIKKMIRETITKEQK